MIIDIKADPETGEPYIEIPDDICDQLDFKVGDTILWTDNKDGSYTLSKSNVS
jgi:hypothetical protein